MSYAVIVSRKHKKLTLLEYLQKIHYPNHHIHTTLNFQIRFKSKKSDKVPVVDFIIFILTFCLKYCIFSRCEIK